MLVSHCFWINNLAVEDPPLGMAEWEDDNIVVERQKKRKEGSMVQNPGSTAHVQRALLQVNLS